MRKGLFVPLLIVVAIASACLQLGSRTKFQTRKQQQIVVVERARKIAQVVGEYDRERQQPTLNRTESSYKIFGTDLGVSFRHKGRTYFLFGDTVGAQGGDAIAYTSDTTPEDGLELTFLHDAAGTYKPIYIPGISQGDFEVPMEGTSVAGHLPGRQASIYIYHTTDHSTTVPMGRSVVARSDDDGETFRYLYDLSTRHFINVSIVEVDSKGWKGLPQQGAGLVIFGSGAYRKSDVRLAFQPAAEIERRASIRYFAGQDKRGRSVWSANEEDAAPLFRHPCVGELSVTYNRFIRKWIMLYNGSNPRGITLRTADRPWGPWSEPQIIFDPWSDNGYGHFIHVSWDYEKCDSVHDPGRENDWGGEYAPYQLEDFARGDSSATTIYFMLSTWNPYTVVLMKATLKKTG